MDTSVTHTRGSRSCPLLRLHSDFGLYPGPSAELSYFRYLYLPCISSKTPHLYTYPNPLLALPLDIRQTQRPILLRERRSGLCYPTDVPEIWENLSEEEMVALKTLERCLLTAFILALPREGYSYTIRVQRSTLDTDAPAYQGGCCLLQSSQTNIYIQLDTGVNLSLQLREIIPPRKRNV